MQVERFTEKVAVQRKISESNRLLAAAAEELEEEDRIREIEAREALLHPEPDWTRERLSSALQYPERSP